MARTVKPCIGYFSHDVDMMQDKKIKIIKAKHGLLGYAVYLRLLEEAYRSDGYFLKADEDFNILFPDENNLSIESYIEILGDCLSKGLFSEELYSQYSILTSERIQKNYCDAISRRTSITFIKEYLMVEPFELLKTSGSDGTLKIDVNILSLNVDNLELNVDGGTQIKEDKNKLDNIKEKEENNAAALRCDYFENQEVNSLFLEFLDLRKKIKCKNTDRAINLLINNLNKYDDCIKKKSLEDSIMNSWKSVYPESVKAIKKQEPMTSNPFLKMAMEGRFEDE